MTSSNMKNICTIGTRYFSWSRAFDQMPIVEPINAPLTLSKPTQVGPQTEQGTRVSRYANSSGESRMVNGIGVHTLGSISDSHQWAELSFQSEREFQAMRSGLSCIFQPSL
uniref:Uncharacterized protein n=1 Tax=Cacopsylla melanoneura TaxID=428564 RepID=A0A8D9EJA5_9HEMI